MAMYVTSTMSLIMKLENDDQTQIWYADDAAAGEHCSVYVDGGIRWL